MRILPPRLSSLPFSLVILAALGVWHSPLKAQCTLTCPANITQSNDPNQCGAVTTYPAPTTTGSCGTVTCSPASGSFFPRGTTTVTCTASPPPPPAAKADGLAGVYQPAPPPTCDFTTTVNDTQPPIITCPANITKSNDPNQCGAVSTFTTTASDNCPGVTVNCNPPSGSFFPVGTTTTTCTSTDASNNTATCSFTDRVNDTQPPTNIAPPDITSGLCAPANIPDGSLGSPTLSDNCPGVTFIRLGVPPGNNFPAGTTIVTYRATDVGANNTDANQRVTVLTNHTIHGHISTTPPSHTGNVSHEHHAQHGHTVPPTVCPPHVPGHSAALAPEDLGGLMTSPPDFVSSLNADGTKVPARRGLPLSLFGSAAEFYIGDQEEWPAANFSPSATGEPLYYTTDLPQVRIGGVNAKVLFSGLAPGLPGVWQINILIPEGLEAGANLPVVVRYADEDLNATVTVE